ncbi:NUDIX hydrolase [Bosea sp. (in: a-proteobacteria)]|uniref:NUDIX hydrolase n=1 Tax=Bosea sp. (in: a-proteobacteria) TaxID=1871050 RepID=UPI002FC638F8
MRLTDRAAPGRKIVHGPANTSAGDRTAGEPIRTQYAALPYRLSATGTLDIMLITSRDTGRWVIPKGWPMRGKTGAEAAAREAYEEAGIIGQASAAPVGAYHYRKRRSHGASVLCRVEVFPLDVLEELQRWPEKRQRRRSWFSAEDAAALVDEEELKALILTAQDAILRAFDIEVAVAAG